MNSRDSEYLISAADCANKSSISELRTNTEFVFWLEADLLNQGRQFLSIYGKFDNQVTVKKLTLSKHYNIRSTINEYGGGSYWLNDSWLYFFNKDDRGIYKLSLDDFKKDGSHNTTQLHCCLAESNLTESNLSQNKQLQFSYADGVVTSNGGFICVRETTNLETRITHQELVFYDLLSDKLSVLHAEHDFYAFPRVHQQQNKILWVSRDHPNMPWDHSILYTADFNANMIEPQSSENSQYLTNIEQAINIANNSLYQPEWLNDNILIVSEHDGSCPFWNLYLYKPNSKDFTALITGEFELAQPLWQLATNTYTFKKNEREQIEIFYYRSANGIQQLDSTLFFLADIANQNYKPLQKPSSKVSTSDIILFNYGLHQCHDNLYYIGAGTKKELSVYVHSTADNSSLSVELSPLKNLAISNNDLKDKISIAEQIDFINIYGQRVYGFYYSPTKVSKALPALIVICHGGPTASTNIAYNPKIQYWTSRGFAVVDVNYSGSTSYGKKYRNRLKQQWGVVDVADCAAAAEYLIQQNKVDKHKIFIRGSSAGGLTVLTALYKYDVFTAGTAYYPVCDLIALEYDMHNFERYYNHYLIGDFAANYQEYIHRSPINFADKISKPLLLFHGIEDKVVPVEQSRQMFSKMKQRNKLHQYIEFEGEEHGFRSIAAITEALEKEYEFYLSLMLKREESLD